MNLTYRQDIDGLRAIAVLAVLWFHAFPSVLPGGFVGVDVFFVISGFLISSSLFKGSGTEKFAIKKFYVRRIRRIFPTLILVLTSTLTCGWFLLTPVEFSNLGKHVVAGTGFVSNLVLWSESGYFDTAAELKPLLHLWSLGVEEQFYIFFPLLIALVVRFKLSRSLVLILVTIMSFTAGVMTTNAAPNAAFYNPLTRVWEILIGALLADLITKPKFTKFSHQFRNIQSISGIGLIVATILLMDGNTPFPSWRALLPTFGTSLLISAGPSALINNFFLRQRMLIAIGLISYPLYLWHWPVLVFLRIYEGTSPSVPLRFVAVGASFLLAAVTFKFVEIPLRFSLPPRKAMVFLVSSFSLISMSGLAVFQAKGFSSRYSGEAKDLAIFSPDYLTDARSGLCWIGEDDTAQGFDKSCSGDVNQSTRVALWGDSHAARFYPGLRKVLDTNISLSQFTRSSCPGILGVEYQRCRESNEYVLKQLRVIRPQTVVIFGRWETYLKAGVSASLRAQFDLTIDELRKIGTQNILILGPAPFWEGSLPINMVDYTKDKKDKSLPRRTKFRLTSLAQDSEKTLKQLVSTRPEVSYFSVFDSMCNNDGCLVSVDGTVNGLTTWDYGHLTTPGAELVATQLLRAETLKDFQTR